MNKAIAGLILGLSGAVAFAGAPLQIWDCEIKDDVEEAVVLERAAEWLDAARKVDGGENIQGHIFFPVAIPSSAHTDVKYVVRWPNFAEFGRFWDASPESDAAELERRALDCPGSSIWEEEVMKESTN